MPEMKTKRPRAVIEVAWEKCPLGLRIFEEVICVFGIHRSLPLGPMRRWKLAEQTMARRFDDAVAIFVFDLSRSALCHVRSAAWTIEPRGR
jgi:hypothetical protein